MTALPSTARPLEALHYYLFNEAQGRHHYVERRPGPWTVMDYFRKARLHLRCRSPFSGPEYEGLAIMTNDGELAVILMYPSRLSDKTYS